MWARQLIRVGLATLLWAGLSVAWCNPWSEPATASMNWTALPAGALSAEQALRTYQERALRQLTTLAGYSDKTTIDAEIPAMAGKGHFSSKREFGAPQSLDYTATNFVGDNFVKTNVIYRLLRSDVERVEKNTASKVAILESNYKFSYKGIRHLNGRPLYAFALKPRRKSSGLFKGNIFIDPQSGRIVQAMGRLSKSPSWWIKRVDFIQDYRDCGEFTMPVQIRSVTEARIVGRVLVNIQHSDYEVRSVEQLNSAQEASDDRHRRRMPDSAPIP